MRIIKYYLQFGGKWAKIYTARKLLTLVHTHTHTNTQQRDKWMDWYKQRFSHVDQSTAPLALTSPCDKVVLVNTSSFHFRDITKMHKVHTHTYSTFQTHTHFLLLPSWKCWEVLSLSTCCLKPDTDRVNEPEPLANMATGQHSNPDMMWYSLMGPKVLNYWQLH